MSETTTTETYELPIEIKFKYPVQVGKETTLSMIVLSEIPDAQAVAKMPIGGSESNLEDLYPIIAAMAKTPEQHIRKIKWPDLKRVLPIVSYFLAE